MTEPASTDLVRRAHELTVSGGAARSTAEVAFEGVPLMWADLPAETRRAARHRTPVVAERAVADDTFYRSGTGGVVEVLRAWRAHRDRLYVAVASRPVDVAAGHRPAGPWEPVALRRYDVSGEPRRRIGWVPPGLPAAASAAGRAAGPGAADPRPVAHAPEHAGAAHAWPYLPEPVRVGAQRAVPLPEDWIGDLLQTWGNRRMARSQEVTVLRRDQDRAVVIRATRELDPAPGTTAAEHDAALAAADWLVEQVVLPIARPQRLEAHREEPAWL